MDFGNPSVPCKAALENLNLYANHVSERQPSIKCLIYFKKLSA